VVCAVAALAASVSTVVGIWVGQAPKQKSRSTEERKYRKTETKTELRPNLADRPSAGHMISVFTELRLSVYARTQKRRKAGL
jgi:hypothetical protein